MDELEQVARESLAALNAGNHAAALAVCHPDVELKRFEGSPDEHDLVRGREAVLEYLAPDLWESQTLEPIEIATGSESVLVHARVRARGAGSGAELEAESYLVFLIRGGLVCRIESYREREAAEQAAGLTL